jgi:DeoR/GlpR family transcriptional regulator of sugar metabolism
MVESAEKLVCLTIAEKLNSRQPFQVCESRKINTLITELPADDPLLSPYKHFGIDVL